MTPNRVQKGQPRPTSSWSSSQDHAEAGERVAADDRRVRLLFGMTQNSSEGEKVAISESDLIGKAREQLRSLHFRRDRGLASVGASSPPDSVESSPAAVQRLGTLS
jgi:hypothetical protein